MRRFSKFSLILSCLLLCLGLTACETNNQQSQPAPVAQRPASQAQPITPVTHHSTTPLGDSVDGEADLTRNLYFIIDGSGSMDEGCSGKKKIDGAKQAVAKFMETVPSNVNLGLWVFASAGSSERVPLGPDNRNAFMQAVNGIRANGGTPLADALRAAADKLEIQYQQQLGYGDYRLIVVTDGEANGLGKAMRYVNDKGFIQVYAISLCIKLNNDLMTKSRDQFAADDYDKLVEGLKQAAAESQTFDETTFEVTN